jgi:hypothetical protein
MDLGIQPRRFRALKLTVIRYFGADGLRTHLGAYPPAQQCAQWIDRDPT